MLGFLMKTTVQSRLKAVLYEYNLNRVQKGLKPLSVKELAENTGLAESTITGLTANRSKGATFDTLAALCIFFDRPPGDFLQLTPGDGISNEKPNIKRRRASQRPQSS